MPPYHVFAYISPKTRTSGLERLDFSQLFGKGRSNRPGQIGLSHLVDVFYRLHVLHNLHVVDVFSKLTPCSPFWDCRIPHFVEPWYPWGRNKVKVLAEF